MDSKNNYWELIELGAHSCIYKLRIFIRISRHKKKQRNDYTWVTQNLSNFEVQEVK
jgi:hypothetical protein